MSCHVPNGNVDGERLMSQTTLGHPAFLRRALKSVVVTFYHQLDDRDSEKRWSRGNPFPRPHLGGEVSVEDALAVQVLQSTGDIERQTDPDTPRQVEVAVQQLLQIPSVNILQKHREKSS